MNNYEKIKNMTIDEMAEFYMVLLNKMLKKIKKDLDKEFKAKDFITFNMYKKSFFKQWLQEESD